MSFSVLNRWNLCAHLCGKMHPNFGGQKICGSTCAESGAPVHARRLFFQKLASRARETITFYRPPDCPQARGCPIGPRLGAAQFVPGFGLPYWPPARGCPIGPRLGAALLAPGPGLPYWPQASGCPIGPRRWAALLAPGSGLPSWPQASGCPIGPRLGALNNCDDAAVRVMSSGALNRTEPGASLNSLEVEFTTALLIKFNDNIQASCVGMKAGLGSS